jgi:hypothetical protein
MKNILTLSKMPTPNEDKLNALLLNEQKLKFDLEFTIEQETIAQKKGITLLSATSDDIRESLRKNALEIASLK